MKIPAALFLRIIIGEELFSDDEEIQVHGEKSVCIGSMVAGLAFGRLLRNGQIHEYSFLSLFFCRPGFLALVCTTRRWDVGISVPSSASNLQHGNFGHELIIIAKVPPSSRSRGLCDTEKCRSAALVSATVHPSVPPPANPAPQIGSFRVTY
jgi:hypothetical protein